MTAAAWPRAVVGQRLLVVRPRRGCVEDHRFAELAELLDPGDLLVVNDAFTLPAALPARWRELELELRLMGPVDEGWAVLFGPGSWRQPTEARPAPPRVEAGDALEVGGESVPVVEVDPRFPRRIRLRLPRSLVWRRGHPVQYSYLDGPVSLAEVQTPYASRPWASEMPSAGRPLTPRVQASLAARGIRVAALTHAAGLSSTGDPALDRALPFPERYEVTPGTWAQVRQARRVIAVGTSVVRALESAARGPLRGTTDLRIGPGTELRVVHGLLSGMHEPEEPHFQLMAAFAELDLLRRACAHAAAAGYQNHEFGDSTLLAD